MRILARLTAMDSVSQLTFQIAPFCRLTCLVRLDPCLTVQRVSLRMVRWRAGTLMHLGARAGRLPLRRERGVALKTGPKIVHLIARDWTNLIASDWTIRQCQKRW